MNQTVDQFEHQLAFEAISFAYKLLDGDVIERLQKLVDAEQRSHSIMHITDPTTYIKLLNDKNFATQIRMARAAIAFHKEIETIRTEMLERLTAEQRANQETEI